MVPARNEAESIAECTSSLLQSNDSRVHVFLVDDGSTDGTADLARNAAAKLGCIDQLTVLNSGNLPANWSGKLWAVNRAVIAARTFNPDFLLFTDADIRHDTAAIATLVSVAEQGNYDLTSFMVRLHCSSLAERLLIPAFVFFFFKLYPPRWVADPRRGTAGAAGGCMLVRPEALERAGGIGAIRSAIIDDCALAKAIKRTGGRVWLGMSNSTESIRPYDSFGAIEQMIARTAFNQLGHSAWLLAGCIAGLLLTYVAAPLLLFSGQALPTVLGAIGCVAMITAYLPMVRFYGLNPAWALTLPVAAIFYMGATIHSAWNYWMGRGGQWKGRAQDITHAPEQ